jgi:hypothetical protein
MSNPEAIYAANDIIRVVKGELESADRALRAGNPEKSQREITSASNKLKKIAARLRYV